MPTDVEIVARSLLGRSLHGHEASLRITEVEAYGGPDDPASHARARTPRSEIMFGQPWRLYVYRSYGTHLCANVVTGPAGEASAVLLRSGELTDGVDVARERRGPQVRDVHLARGPGNLAKALGLTMDDLHTDLLEPEGVHVGGSAPPPHGVSSGPRVGVSKAADVRWRFWISDDPTVSNYRRSPRA